LRDIHKQIIGPKPQSLIISLRCELRLDKKEAVRGNRSMWLDLNGAFPKLKMSARKHPLNVTSNWGKK